MALYGWWVIAGDREVGVDGASDNSNKNDIASFICSMSKHKSFMVADNGLLKS